MTTPTNQLDQVQQERVRRIPTFPRAATWTVAAATVFALTPAAQADPPSRTPEVVTHSATTTELCDFPVTISGTLSGVVTVRDNGTTTTVTATPAEQDTFTANGITLTSMVYRFRLSLVIDDSTGKIVGGDFTGVAEKVPLPNGELFITAGHTYEVLHPTEDIVIIPDVGNTGDVAALCAALS
jgi:hypothetical protein